MVTSDGILTRTNLKAESRRRSVVDPLLKAKGLSIHDWAQRAIVDHHTAANYLKGKTNPYPDTRKKLANALGLSPNDLPN